jgi:hypothetical protein
MYGEAEMVSLDSKSASFPKCGSVRASFDSMAKRFKLFRVPQQEEGHENMCIWLIGEGTTFCTAAAGDMYISKTPTSAMQTQKVIPWL